MKMTRKANGQGHTYKVGNSYRTAIRKGGFTITAMGATAQESRKRAKAKLDALPNLGGANNLHNNSKMNLESYLSTWLEEEHKHHIAHSTFTRYKALAKCHINPAIADINSHLVIAQVDERVWAKCKVSTTG
jgi:hypothetical protein